MRLGMWEKLPCFFFCKTRSKSLTLRGCLPKHTLFGCTLAKTTLFSATGHHTQSSPQWKRKICSSDTSEQTVKTLLSAKVKPAPYPEGIYPENGWQLNFLQWLALLLLVVQCCFYLEWWYKHIDTYLCRDVRVLSKGQYSPWVTVDSLNRIACRHQVIS